MFNYKKLAGILIGNTMQFYDFTIYAFLASQIGKEFFNFDDTFISYLMVFIVFASGYVTRPLGSLIFGWVGDRRGRSKSLLLAIYFAMLATFFIGLIPGYQALGIMSPIVLVFLRLIQGLSVSGEEGGAVILLFEGYSFKRTGYIGSLVLSSVLSGVLLGMIICLSVTKLISEGMLGDWAWRVPFLVALPLGLVGVWLRNLFSDAQLFEKAKKSGLLEKNPISKLFRNHSLSVIYSMLIVSTYSVITSTLIVHLPYLLAEKIGIGQQNSLSILIVSLLVIISLTPYFGKLCNQKNVFSLYRIYLGIIVLTSPFIFYLIASGKIILTTLGILIFAVEIAMYSSIVFITLVGIFPFGVRYSGVSFVFNSSVAIFSSTTPLVLIFLEKYMDSNSVGGWYISATSLISLISIWLFKEKLNIKYFHQNTIEQNIYQPF